MLKNLALFFLLILILALPTAEGNIEIGGLSLVKIGGLLAFGVSFLLIFAGKPLEVEPTFHAAVVLYLAWIILSFTWGSMPSGYETAKGGSSSDHLIKEYTYILVTTFLIFYLVNTPSDFKWVLGTYLVGCFWLVFLMVSQYQVNGQTVRHEIEGFDANEVAVKLAIGLPLAIYLWKNVKALGWRLLGLIYLPAAIFTIVITGSRTGAIVMVLGLLGFLPAIWRASWIGKLAGLLMLILSIIIVANIVPQKTIERILSANQEIATGTLNERSTVWSYATQLWQESPILGQGLGTFRRLVSKFNVDYTAHNSYVAITVEQGLIGLLLYLILIGVVFNYIWKIPGDNRILALSLLLVVVVGQLSLTLQDRFYIWVSYCLVVLSFYINKKNYEQIL